ncbi:MAG: hypothetical protein JXB26_11960 [Candidatus Aminicenantes bacterium]|nr:hypothetical protein [Candidatus Aminicenantes bacterium]
MRNLLTILLLLLSVQSGYPQTDTLPKPSGMYATGVNYISFTDEGRKELFDNTGEKNREITVKAWYPADEKTDSEPYLLNADFAIKYCMFPELYRNLKTNSSRDIPISTDKKKYPILIFSHGWGEHFSQNSILMEELASHGYIVFSIAYHFACRYSEYPDGRIHHLDVKSHRFQKIWRELQNPKSIELMNRMANIGSDKERVEAFRELSNMVPTGLKESPKYWAEDIHFFLDQLQNINAGNKIFKGRLDLDKIGVFGMSMGGMASSEISIIDSRVKACICIDSGLHGTALDSTLKIPLLFMNSQRFLGYGPLFTSKSLSDCYSLSVKNSGHMNFTDYSLYPSPLAKWVMGTIDGNRVIEIMNVMVLNFFDKYLREKQDIDILKESEKFPEIEAVASIKIK